MLQLLHLSLCESDRDYVIQNNTVYYFLLLT